MQFKKIVGGLVLVGLIYFPGNFAFAKSVKDEIAELKARIAQLEEKLSKQGGSQH